MGLIDRLKSALGLGAGQSPDTVDGPSADSDDVDVAVEHEPATASEDAVKGTDTSDDTAGDSTDTTPDVDAADLESIKGIGPTYADRLQDIGIADTADLAAADAESLADETDISETRVQNWIDRARA
jgi:predicted flap endonuclease-1-like 5' DNA nuclease